MCRFEPITNDMEISSLRLLVIEVVGLASLKYDTFVLLHFNDQFRNFI